MKRSKPEPFDGVGYRSRKMVLAVGGDYLVTVQQVVLHQDADGNLQDPPAFTHDQVVLGELFSFVPCLDKDANGSAVRRADPVVLRDEVIPEVDVRQRSFLDRLAEISDVINDNGQLFLPLAEVLTGFDSDCDVHQTFDSPVSYISLFPAILSAIEVPPSRYPMSLS